MSMRPFPVIMAYWLEVINIELGAEILLPIYWEVL
jgi:hypothetical protein